MASWNKIIRSSEDNKLRLTSRFSIFIDIILRMTAYENRLIEYFLGRDNIALNVDFILYSDWRVNRLVEHRHDIQLPEGFPG